MSRLIAWMMLITVAVAIFGSRADACPLCKEAITASGQDASLEDEDSGIRSAKAYNANILSMIGIMYGSLLVVAFLIYRGVKKNAVYMRQMQSSPQL